MKTTEQTKVSKINASDTESKKIHLDLVKAYDFIEQSPETILLDIVGIRISNLIATYKYMISEKTPPSKILNALRSKLDDIQFFLAIDNSKDILANMLFSLKHHNNDTLESIENKTIKNEI